MVPKVFQPFKFYCITKLMDSTQTTAQVSYDMQQYQLYGMTKHTTYFYITFFNGSVFRPAPGLTSLPHRVPTVIMKFILPFGTSFPTSSKINRSTVTLPFVDSCITSCSHKKPIKFSFRYRRFSLTDREYQVSV